MRSQPNRDYISDDVVQTPPELARRLVAHFQPSGRILEPCKGEGNFLRALEAHAKGNAETLKSEMLKKTPSKNRETRGVAGTSGKARGSGSSKMSAFSFQVSAFQKPQASTVSWTEIKAGRDFFAWDEKVDWIVTNPPWSKIRPFLQHAMRLADHVVFLLTINHMWTKARVRDVREAGFGLREIVLVDMPPTFPQSGFQLGAVYINRGWRGAITLTDFAEG